MDEHALRGLIDEVKAGRIGRRQFVRSMVALGLTGPLAAQMLATAGVASAQSKGAEFTAIRRGGGGPLRALWWQAPTLLNPHFATGTKDQDASRIFYEPLAAFDPDGNVIPILAAEAPAVGSGTLARDLTWVIWRLKRGVTWHDGKPFTADDVQFNWEYVADPATAAVTSGAYHEVAKVETLDTHTVKVVFKKPQPFWADAFCGNRGMIVPKHVFDPYRGAKSREAPANLKPVGTGPYRFVDFKPGDVVRGELNPAYHVANRPFFDTIEMKGGGDAVSAARAVLQTGEYDYAWNMQVEDEILRRLEQGGKGRVNIFPTGNPEHIQCNFTDPWVEVDGERSSLKTKHPILSDPAVREALSLLVDKDSVEKHIYGRAGVATPNFFNNPERFRSKTAKYEFNIDKANAILDKAGFAKGPDGIRAKDGKKLRFVYQTSINQPRQKNQAIVKQACQKAGIDIEVKAVTASVFFSSDVANPDTYPHFYADLQMYNNGPQQPDPEVFMRQFCSWEAAAKANKWQGRNITRWQSKEYDDIYKAAQLELDPIKRAAMFIKLNDLVVNNHVVIPVVARLGVAAVNNRLVVELTGWDNNTWALPDWYREA